MSRFVASCLAIFLFAACGPTTYVVQGRNPFIGVDGTVKVEKENGSHVVFVELENLVPPNRVQQSLTQYVMWITNPGAQPSRVATLVFDEDDREGRARATAPDARFTVTVTAEGNNTPTAPSTNIVFQQAIDVR